MRAIKLKKSLKVQMNKGVLVDSAKVLDPCCANQRNIFNKQTLKIHLKRFPFDDLSNTCNMDHNSDLVSANKTKSRRPNVKKPTELKERRMHKQGAQKQNFSNNLKKCGVPIENHNCKEIKVILEKTDFGNYSQIDATNCKDRSKEGQNCSLATKELQVVLDRTVNNKDVLENGKSTNQNRLSTPLVNRLRKCEQKKYLEESETTLEESNAQENLFSRPKVPVYKQIIATKEETKKEDPYELDISDSDKEQKLVKKKKRKRDPSDVHNKTIFHVLQKLEKKDKTTKEKKKRVVKKVNQYENNVQEAVQKIIKRKNFVTSGPKKGKLEEAVPSLNLKAKPQTDGLVLPLAEPSRTDKVLKNLIECEIVSSQKTIAATNQNKTVSMLQNDPFDVLKHSSVKMQKKVTAPPPTTQSTNEPVFQNYLSPCPSPALNDLNDDENHFSSDDEFFGFKDEENEPENRIKILSNVVLNNSIKFQIRPKANSTMINYNQSPWRIPIRQPSQYLLQYKKNALPCLQQDAILDHTLVDSIEEHCSKNRTGHTLSKSIVQTSILDYVDTSLQSCERDQENIQVSSLYNYEEFNIAIPKRNTTQRRVLGALNEQNQNLESTPVKQVQLEVPSPDVSFISKSELSKNASNNSGSSNKSSFTETDNNKTYFGFESMESEKVVVETRRSRNAKPFRMIIDVKKYNKRTNIEDIEEVAAVEELPSVLSNNEGINDGKEADVLHEVQLFNDAEPELLATTDNMPLTYSRPRTRKKKVVVSNDSDSEEEEEKPKKKKKDQMTDAEKKEFEKWASQFNAMCEEVEKHELEIE